MKIRHGFVSNSSSSSFIINKRFISPYQTDLLLIPLESFEEVCKENYEHAYDAVTRMKGDPSLEEYMEMMKDNLGFGEDNINDWDVTNCRDSIKFSTDMDNFDYLEYAEFIGIDNRAFK